MHKYVRDNSIHIHGFLKANVPSTLACTTSLAPLHILTATVCHPPSNTIIFDFTGIM